METICTLYIPHTVSPKVIVWNYFESACVFNSACHLRLGVESSICSIVSELRKVRVWEYFGILTFGLGLSTCAMFEKKTDHPNGSRILHLQSPHWTLWCRGNPLQSLSPSLASAATTSESSSSDQQIFIVKLM